MRKVKETDGMPPKPYRVATETTKTKDMEKQFSKIRLTAENEDSRIILEVPSDSTTEEMCNMFLTMMLGLTYQYDNVIETMHSFSGELLECREMDLHTVECD